MGLKGWFPFIRKKGYDPPALPQSSIASFEHTSTRRIDVLGSFYNVIKEAYSNHALDDAHCILERHVMSWGSRDNLILYVDGQQAIEKQHTAEIRQGNRDKASLKCTRALDTLENRIENNLSVRKRHFTDVRTSLSLTFYWSLEARQSFVAHMTGAGCHVRFCETEADVAIAKECQPGDIVVSCDSDMMAYASIATLLRPISKSLFLVYDLNSVLRNLRLSRAQLTTLAIVSSNDYSSNIYSLGPAANYTIVKSLDGEGNN